MSNIIYGVTEERFINNGAERISYGIAAYSNEEGESLSAILMTISDISADKKRVADLVDMCNNLGLSLIHLEDAVLDLLDE